MDPEVKGINIRTLALEVNPELIGRLKSCFSDGESNAEFIYDGSIRLERDGTETIQGKINRSLPMVHFMSMLVFEDQHHDPLLVIEINFDGDAGALWPAIDQCLRDPLRKILQCTKRPRSRLGDMYDAIFYSNDSLPIAPYLEAVAKIPLTPYRGARGMSRQRIVNEQQLYDDIQQFLGDGKEFQNKDAADLYKDINDNLSISYPKVIAEARNDPNPWRKGIALDYFYLVLAIFCILWSIPIMFGLPIFVSLLLSDGIAWQYVKTFAFIVPLLLLIVLQGPAEDISKITNTKLDRLSSYPIIRWIPKNFINSVIAYLPCFVVAFWVSAVSLFLLAFLLVIPSLLIGEYYLAGAEGGYLSWLHPSSFCSTLHNMWQYVFPSALLGVTVLWAWLRFREVSASSHDGASAHPDTLREMDKRENYVMHNHMGSLLTVKPGILRYILNRVNHWLLRSLARTVFRDGELGSMRTIHFAHWALIENGNRLLFLSNFDGTWESYLDDFTVKASKGVNLAWSQCIGFPFVRFLMFGGAESGALFKNWARHSMTKTLFWYSAYPDLTVEMIHRNNRVTKGLSQGSLASAAEYEVWARDL